MLPKGNRLNLRLERDRFNKGERLSSPNFSLLILLSPVPRFGFLISKKIAKSAVERNLLRRRLSEIIRTNLDSISPADYLIIPKSSIIKLDYESLQKSLLSILKSSPAL